MLYGIISDVHSNLEALEAVLAQLKSVDQLVCSGDLVGYGPNPNEVLKTIQELGVICVAGNHDKAVCGQHTTQWFNKNALAAVEWTKQNINQDSLNFLSQLPLTLILEDFQLVHGSLRAPLEDYVASISDALPTFTQMIQPICFVGHLHRPLFIAQKHDGYYDGRSLVSGEELITTDYAKLIINTGSVGQPRDGDSRASYAIYDPKAKLFSLHRVAYEIKKVQEKMQLAGLPEKLIKRLQLGS